MQNKSSRTSDSQSPVARQMIFCLAAIGIMGLGVWSLIGLNAPYHPDAFSDEVSRDSTSGILILDDTN